jgi:hypothetical protein
MVRLVDIANRTAASLAACAGHCNGTDVYSAIVHVKNPLRAVEEIKATAAEISEQKPVNIHRAVFDSRWEQELAKMAKEFEAANRREPTWLELPWFALETYFYACVRQACGGDALADAFAPQKAKLLTDCLPALPALARVASSGAAAALATLIRAGLRGNTADLSMHPGGTSASGDGDLRVLIDDADKVEPLLRQGRSSGKPVVLVVDNAGFELCTDLAIADFVVESGIASKVIIYAKEFPAFVSDVTRRDFEFTIRDVANHAGDGSQEAEAVREMGRRWASRVKSGQFELHVHDFWNSSLPLWRGMPSAIQAALTSCSLCIFKGDANYRRAHGDLRWPDGTPTASVLASSTALVSTPVLFVRTLKSPVLSGVPVNTTRKLDEEDPTWRFSGKVGIIQLVMGHQ